MSDSRWINKKRGEVSALLVDALSLIGHQTYLSSEDHNVENIHESTKNNQANGVPTLNLQNINSPYISPNISYQTSPRIDRSPDVVPRLHLKTTPEKRCVQCNYVCVTCGNALSVRDDVKSISVFSDRSFNEKSTATSSASAESARRGFIENSILSKSGLSYDDTRNRQLATLKSDLIKKGGFSVPLRPCESNSSGDSFGEDEIVRVLGVDAEEYMHAVIKDQHNKETKEKESTKQVQSNSDSEDTLDDSPLFTNSHLSNPANLTGIAEEAPPQPLQASQLAPFEEPKPPPANDQLNLPPAAALPSIGPLLKTPAKPASPRKAPGKRKVSLGFTASDFPPLSGQTSVEHPGLGRSGRGIKKMFGSLKAKITRK